MKSNSSTKISCGPIILVPYRDTHVEKYHQWMCSEELQKLTASEPLTLDQEYDMQKSWYLDDDKCTYIILDARIYKETSEEVLSMIGDTNLYLDLENPGVAEAEIMIADQTQRGQKRGWFSMLCMLRYGWLHLKIKTFIAKIGEQNLPSLNLFRKMGFIVKSFSSAFQEHTLELEMCQERIDWLVAETSDYEELPYS